MPLPDAGPFPLDRNEHFINMRIGHGGIIPDNPRLDKQCFRIAESLCRELLRSRAARDTCVMTNNNVNYNFCC